MNRRYTEEQIAKILKEAQAASGAYFYRITISNRSGWEAVRKGKFAIVR